MISQTFTLKKTGKVDIISKPELLRSQKQLMVFKFSFKKRIYEKTVDDIKLRTLEVKNKREGKLSNIEITDEEGAGKVKLQIWGPNKKNKMVTVQVSKSSNSQVKHVDILTNKVVKPKLLRGATIKELDKSFFTNPSKPQA